VQGKEKKEASSIARLKGPGTLTAVPQSSASFGQVTTCRRKHKLDSGLQSQERSRKGGLEGKSRPEKQGNGNELLRQLQRLQLLQQEAQDLLQ
jgi:hypothetical protein